MTNISNKRKSCSKIENIGNHDEFLNRITKTLYYAKLPANSCLTLPVTELAAELFTEVKSRNTLQRLDVNEASRISQNACVSPCSLVLALLYLERLKDCNPEYLQKVAPSELFLVTLMVASKFLHDDGEEDEVFNAQWAAAGDLSLSEMNSLELQFLIAINWEIYVRKRDFWAKLNRLEKDLAYKEAQKRGWFSYTELSYLLDSLQLVAVAQTLLGVSSVCMAAYTAGVVTILGSTYLASHLPGTPFAHKQALQVNESTLRFDTTSTTQNNFEMVTEYKSEENWMDSALTWLPEYADLPSETNEKYDHMRAFVTSSETTAYKDMFIQGPEGLVTKINWKETLGLTLEFPFYDWRYYLNSASRMFLSCRY